MNKKASLERVKVEMNSCCSLNPGWAWSLWLIERGGLGPPGAPSSNDAPHHKGVWLGVKRQTGWGQRASLGWLGRFWDRWLELDKEHPDWEYGKTFPGEGHTLGTGAPSTLHPGWSGPGPHWVLCGLQANVLALHMSMSSFIKRETY